MSTEPVIALVLGLVTAAGGVAGRVRGAHHRGPGRGYRGVRRGGVGSRRLRAVQGHAGGEVMSGWRNTRGLTLVEALVLLLIVVVILLLVGTLH